MLTPAERLDLRRRLSSEIERVRHDVLPEIEGTLAARDVRIVLERAETARRSNYVPWMQSGWRHLRRIEA